MHICRVHIYIYTYIYIHIYIYGVQGSGIWAATFMATNARRTHLLYIFSSRSFSTCHNLKRCEDFHLKITARFMARIWLWLSCMCATSARRLNAVHGQQRSALLFRLTTLKFQASPLFLQPLLFSPQHCMLNASALAAKRYILHLLLPLVLHLPRTGHTLSEHGTT